MEKIKIKRTSRTDELRIGGWCGYITEKEESQLKIIVRDLDGEYDEYTISTEDVELWNLKETEGANGN